MNRKIRGPQPFKLDEKKRVAWCLSLPIVNSLRFLDDGSARQLSHRGSDGDDTIVVFSSEGYAWDVGYTEEIGWARSPIGEHI